MGKTEDSTLRTMKQLWRAGERSASSPGPKPRFELNEIVDAAIETAYANPRDGVSMRAVAERLGVTAMALYGYIADKDALVSLAYDAIHSEMPDLGPGSWRDKVMVWVDGLVDLHTRHAWALEVSYARPVLGPEEQRVLESLVGVLRSTDLDPESLRRVVGLLYHAVRGTAQTIVDARSFEEMGEMTENEWWHSSSTALSEVVPDFAEQFPNTIWLLSQSAQPPTIGDGPGYVEWQAMANLRAGIGILLDGMEAAMTPTEAVPGESLHRR